jgi:hypothetical protein
MLYFKWLQSQHYEFLGCPHHPLQAALPRLYGYIHRKKKVREFPVPSRDVTTKLSLGGNNDVITEFFLPRRSLVSDIPAGDGKIVNHFLRFNLHPFGRELYYGLNYHTYVNNKAKGNFVWLRNYHI